MKSIRDLDIKNKRVLVRCDFNVPLDKKGQVGNDSKIVKTIPTIEYLVQKQAKVILMSHLNDPGGKVVEGLRLNSVQEKLLERLNLSIQKASDCIGKEIEEETQKMMPGEILLLENLRFHKGEEENSPEFARSLANLGDIYINDAFSVCHRKHASVVGVPKFLPAFPGFLLENEVKILSQIMENHPRPFIVILGGVKVESKIKLINRLFEKVDHLLVGGEMANAILRVKGVLNDRPFLSEGVVKAIKSLDLFSPKLHLPVDVLASPDATGSVYVENKAIGKVKKEEMLLDIGKETIKIYSNIIKEAKTIILAGPLGFFEEKAFEFGTKKVVEEIIKNKTAFKIAGGGGTLFALSKFNLINEFDHVSTGGGAMLQFLAGDELPGLKALE